jgi:DNA-binding NtrC family response regulator
MKNFKVLVVDNDDDVAFVIQKILDSRGYEVRRARGYEEGYERFISFRPDLVITDVMIGKQDGLKLMDNIRSFAPNIETIYMTGGLNQCHSLLQKERKRHRASCLEKPFAGTDLLRLVYAHEHGWEVRAV